MGYALVLAHGPEDFVVNDTDTTLTLVLLEGGFVLFLTAYVLRDILWLRAVTVAGYILFAALCIIRGGLPLYQVLPWYVAFMTINGLQMVQLVRERWIIKLSPEEERLWAAAFSSLDRVVFKRLMRCGQWRLLSEGFVLTTEGRRSSRLYLIYEGSVSVTVADQSVTRLGLGQFVGEIGFIADRPATAATTVRFDDEGDATRCVVWNVPKLRRQMQRDGELKSLVFAAVGSDLARKISAQTVVAAKRPPSSVEPLPLADVAPATQQV